MQTKQVVSFDEAEQRTVRDRLPQLALAFPARDEEGSDDALAWRLLKRLGHHDTIFDLELLAEIRTALETAAAQLSEMSAESYWQKVGAASGVPGSRQPAEVLVESALVALRSADELRQLLAEATLQVSY